MSMERGDTLVLFLVLQEMLWIFPFGLMWAVGCWKLPLLCWCTSLYPPGPLSSKPVGFVKGLFCIWDDHVVFVSQFVYVVDCIYQYTYVEPSLPLWGQTYLIIEDNLFWCVLGFGLQVFYWEFLHLVPKENWSVFLSLSIGSMTYRQLCGNVMVQKGSLMRGGRLGGQRPRRSALELFWASQLSFSFSQVCMPQKISDILWGKGRS